MIHEQDDITATDCIIAIRELLDANDSVGLNQFLHQLEDVERVRIVSRFPVEIQTAIVVALGGEQAAEVLHSLPIVQSSEILGELEPEVAVDVLKNFPMDEQADLISEISAEDQESILAIMDAADADAVRDLSDYDNDLAGGIMVVEYLSFEENETANGVINHLRENVEKYNDFDVQYAFVVKKDRTLIGVLRLRDLLLSSGSSQIGELMIKDPLSVSTETSLPDLHVIFTEHRFVGLPIVDSSEKLVGIVRRSDVESAMAEKFSTDLRRSQGVISEELRTMPLMLRSRRRLAWLSVNILLNIVAASVIAAYQDILTQVIALAVFLPIISDMSGCSGNQAVAVSMRELSLGLVKASEVLRVWLKELTVGLINGFALGLLVAFAAILWKGNPWLGIVIGMAMFVNTIIAVSIGGTLPLIMRGLKLDPALASGPILTTVTDMCGFFLVLSLASQFIDKLV
ncbi:magnesium transporter [Pirellulaceae bacterium]|jgi:magnesium transporter|nr:magnesium transporter [Pirellulaceae bacterium]MDB4640245.1 magnesium transporter [Pirellulaceae bacterium]